MNAISRIETDEEYAARIDALNAAEEAAWEAERASRPPPDDHVHGFVELLDHAREALCDWTMWLADRAEKRRIPQGFAEGPEPYGKDPALRVDPTRGAMEAVIDAAWEFTGTIEDGAEDSVVDAASAAMHAAVTHAKSAAEDQRRERINPQDTERRDRQAEEVETSHLRGWTRALDDIDHCRRQARDYPADANLWLHTAKNGLIFFAPPLTRHFS
jgi:hypothetical protein